VRSGYHTDIACDNHYLPGLGVVMVFVEVSVDIYLGLQPCYEERAVAGACLLKDVGGQQSRSNLLRVDAVLNAAQVLFVVVVEDNVPSDTLGAVSATSGAELVGVCAGEIEKGGLHVVGGESWNFEERWLVKDNRSVPCLRRVVLGFHSDLLAVNSVRRLTGSSVTEDHEVGVVVFIRWQAGEHPQPALEHGGVNTSEVCCRSDFLNARATRVLA
jgi:hypothetical protein